MLTLDGEIFVVGRSKFFDTLDGSEPTAKIYVKVLPGDIEVPILSQVDTGAAWSILERDIAEGLGLFDKGGLAVALSTRKGTVNGYLVRVPMTVLADEGDSLQVDGTLFVSQDWDHGNFIGYCGLLERIRFGVDPRTNDFYFGTA